MIEDPEDEGEQEADGDAGDHREVELTVAAAAPPVDVAWEASDGDVEATEEQDDGSGDQEEGSESDEHFSEVGHDLIVTPPPPSSYP